MSVGEQRTWLPHKTLLRVPILSPVSNTLYRYAHTEISVYHVQNDTLYAKTIESFRKYIFVFLQEQSAAVNTRQLHITGNAAMTAVIDKYKWTPKEVEDIKRSLIGQGM